MIGQKPVDVSAWFFKAHFFQDPVQPGSLGVEALLQLLQFFVIDTGMADGVDSPRFEPLMVDRPFTWKYRGQVTPDSTSITTVMEITDVGHDDRGPFVVGTGSLWCDGLRIYELAGVGMRVVSGTSRPDAAALAVGDVTEAMRAYWGPRRGSPAGWLGDDLMAALTETYVRRVMVPAQGGLAGVHGRSAIYVANHQVQIESVLLTQILPALTGVPITSVANAKHERRWIGELVDALGFVSRHPQRAHDRVLRPVATRVVSRHRRRRPCADDRRCALVLRARRRHPRPQQPHTDRAVPAPC